MRDSRQCIQRSNQFAAFTRDAIDNKAFAAKGRLTMPVLAARLVGDGRSERLIGSDFRRRCDLRRHFQRGALDDEDQPAAAIAATRASSTRNSDEITDSGQRRDLGYQASDFIH
jgi:hypothetical protein